MKPGFFFDIQFFAEERTEPATPRKRHKTREEGRVAKSQDLSASVVIITGLLVIYILGMTVWESLLGMFRNVAWHLSSPLMQDDKWWVNPVIDGGRAFAVGWLPAGLLCALFAVVVLVYQVGFVVTAKPLSFNIDRFNPVSGLKKIISMRTIVEMLKGILKALVLLGMLFWIMRNERDLMMSVMMYPLGRGSGVIIGKIWDLSIRMAVILFLLGVADYMYQRWEFDKSIKMSKQEIKEEYRQMEGDPQIKRRIRQKQRELASRRMMADVPKADVIVTNPSHIAVAIQYDQKSMSAPIVVAKGEDFVARKIRDIAAEHDIPIVENKPLARALMDQVEIGEAIPEDLYRAVAEVLAFVYRLKKSA
ncbi:MAG: flagellar biosynthesis protein FlhB [Synergistaceae bacterium]|jgi:flagellar biosynthetic protein FlhB|nr:flagellar biosynthesis protein FlhB [Synergistaceae bacterium]